MKSPARLSDSRLCKWCGLYFFPQSPHGRYGYCSDPCKARTPLPELAPWPATVEQARIIQDSLYLQIPRAMAWLHCGQIFLARDGINGHCIASGWHAAQKFLESLTQNTNSDI